MKDQVWGTEERHGSPISLSANQSFEITIEVNHNFFKVLFNGAYYCTFNNRLPTDDKKFISISGSCTIAYIMLDRNGMPGSMPTNPIYPPVHLNPHPPMHVHPQPPPPPPIHHPSPPPPYPGFYPGHGTPAPYTLFQDELKYKMSHLKHRDD